LKTGEFKKRTAPARSVPIRLKYPKRFFDLCGNRACNISTRIAKMVMIISE
jgi:hypothetical protein